MDEEATERGRGFSRRGFLRGATVLALAGPAAGKAWNTAMAADTPILAYVGTYSSPEGPEGSQGRGEGIYLFQMDPSTGVLAQRQVFRNHSNPSWLAFDPSRTHLYVADETQTFEGKPSGSVSAYSINRVNGDLALLNTVSSGGAGPAQLSVHPSGKYVLVANYHGGTVAVLPIRPTGEFEPATDVQHDHGTPGAAHATSGPPGSFAISGHEAPHAHMIRSDPAGKFVISTDLGLDRVYVWKFDAEHGKLSPNDPAFVSVPSGDGPRHFAFHPNGKWMYLLGEESSTLVVFDYDAARGRLTAKQTVSTLPQGFAGTSYTSEVRISDDGRFLYAANRLHDSIAIFSIGETGSVSWIDEAWTRGDYPRSFSIDPSGNFLYSCNQRSDAITSFRVDKKTGGLTFTGRYTPVGTPAIIIFLAP